MNPVQLIQRLLKVQPPRFKKNTKGNEKRLKKHIEYLEEKIFNVREMIKCEEFYGGMCDICSEKNHCYTKEILKEIEK